MSNTSLWDTAKRYFWEAVATINQAIPRLVWKGDELDVMLVLTTDGTIVTDEPAEKVPFKTQALKEALLKLQEAGIMFDTGVRLNGTRWYLDSSLSGPMRVKFIGRAKKPMRRLEW